jgi:hypothetical protein
MGLIMLQPACADDFSVPSDFNFSGPAAETLGLSLLSPARATETSNPLPGYPLSQEELRLVFSETPAITGKVSADSMPQDSSAEPALANRLSRSMQLQSEESGILKTLLAEEEVPGVHLDVDPIDDEVVIEYRIGF